MGGGVHTVNYKYWTLANPGSSSGARHLEVPCLICYHILILLCIRNVKRTTSLFIMLALKLYISIYINVIVNYFSSTGILLTTPVLNGYIGEPGSLFCHFKGNDKWLVIQWLRRRPSDGVYYPFISLMASSSNPEWTPDTDIRLVERVHPYIRRKGREINFSLYFRPLACEDQGEYRCLIVGLAGQQFVESEILLQGK